MTVPAKEERERLSIEGDNITLFGCRFERCYV